MLARKIILAVVILIALIALWFYRAPIEAALRWLGNYNAVIASIREYGLWGPAILFLLFILQVFFAFIPGQALMIGSGILYGFVDGFLLTWISLVFGGQIAFWLSRKFGRPFAKKWISPNTLERWDKSAAGQGMAFYTISLVMPFVPNDAMCYVAGLGSISFKRFLLANMLGRGIASSLTVTVGANLVEIPALIWAFTVGFALLGIAGWVFVRRMQKINKSID